MLVVRVHASASCCHEQFLHVHHSHVLSQIIQMLMMQLSLLGCDLPHAMVDRLAVGCAVS